MDGGLTESRGGCGERKQVGPSQRQCLCCAGQENLTVGGICSVLSVL